MPQVGFEATTPVFWRAKTVHALDRAATVIGIASFCHLYNFLFTVYLIIQRYIIRLS
jgi:hypothetical protein